MSVICDQYSNLRQLLHQGLCLLSVFSDWILQNTRRYFANTWWPSDVQEETFYISFGGGGIWAFKIRHSSPDKINNFPANVRKYLGCVTFNKKHIKLPASNCPSIYSPFPSSHTPLLIRFNNVKMDDTAEGLTLPLHTHACLCVYPQRNVDRRIAQHLLTCLSVSVGHSQRMTHHLALMRQFLYTQYKDKTYSTSALPHKYILMTSTKLV